MKLIELQMLQAIKERKNWRKDNTEVRVLNSDTPHILVLLYGNVIYEQNKDKAYWSLCGWDTTTTRSRLHSLGVLICQRKYKPHLWVDGGLIPIDSHKVYTMGEEIDERTIIVKR